MEEGRGDSSSFSCFDNNCLSKKRNKPFLKYPCSEECEVPKHSYKCLSLGPLCFLVTQKT